MALLISVPAPPRRTTSASAFCASAALKALASAQPVADPHQAELVAAVDLDVLGEAAGSDRRDRGVRGEVGEPVGLPVGVAGVVDEPAEAQQLGEPLAVEREP